VCIAVFWRMYATSGAVHEGERMEDSLYEALAWLFVKTDAEIVAEAEVAALHSMLLAEDPRPERSGANG
jgi:hypothetical protein